MRFLFSLAMLTLLASSCTQAPEPSQTNPISTTFSALTNWERNDHTAALTAFLESCKIWDKRPKDKAVGCNNLKATVGQWQQICTTARSVDVSQPRDIRNFFEQQFTPYPVPHDSEDDGLFTGYYIPEIRGSLSRGGPYQTPVYGKPADLQSSKAYHTRAEINAGKLAGRGLEIAWVADPVQLFFIEIQGSGIIRLAEGGFLSIGYAAKNNQPYVALGRLMQKQGLLEAGSINLFSIKQWLYNHPDQAQKLMEQNPRFIFFRPLPDNKIRGAQGAALTAQRSLAVDRNYIPYGMPVYVQVELAKTRFGPATPFNQLMIAQDTGGAIKGKVRGDIYFGHGELAEALAGHQAKRGRYTLLLPKFIASRGDIATIKACNI